MKPDTLALADMHRIDHEPTARRERPKARTGSPRGKAVRAVAEFAFDRIVAGDAVECLRDLPRESVDLSF